MIPRILPIETAGRRCWMVVDDNQEILSLLQEAVASMFSVEVAAYNSPHAALAAFRTAPERFQCVITDLEMPGMNGFDFCRELRAIVPRIPVLLATGSQAVTRAEATERGFSGMLTKPFSLSTLRREITPITETE
jgi:CheY-like chemotaxis protein